MLLGSGLRVGMRSGSERGKVGSSVDFYDPLDRPHKLKFVPDGVVTRWGQGPTLLCAVVISNECQEPYKGFKIALCGCPAKSRHNISSPHLDC